MRKTLFSGLLLSLLFVGLLSAAPIDLKRARDFAQQQLQSVQPLRGGEYDLSLSYTSAGVPVRGDESQKDYYVFQVNGERGFVIVAGDDRMPQPILGYSLESKFGVEGMPAHIKHWLDCNAYQVQQLRGQESNDPGEELSRIYEKYTTPIEPLMPNIRWSQDDPYDMLTPQRSPSGCLATAMAQVMRYHCWPLESRGKIAYVDMTGNFRKYQFGHRFDWENMTNIYNSRSTDVERAAVALLMLECGYAAQMRWSRFGSGAYLENAFKGLRMFLDYSPKLQYVQQMYYTIDEWLEIIIKELAEKRPVLYAGAAFGVGHAFVCDGYDGKGLFHFNWGWEGISNGYYSLSDMYPRVQSTGGGGAGGYNMLVDALIGWEPNREGAQKHEVPNIKAYEMETPVPGAVFSQAKVFNDVNGIALRSLSNNGFDSVAFRPILKLVDGNGAVVREYAAYGEDDVQIIDGTTTMRPTEKVPFDVSFEGIADGEYHLQTFFRTVADEKEYPLHCLKRFGEKWVRISDGNVTFFKEKAEPKLVVNTSSFTITEDSYNYIDFEVTNEGNTAYTALFGAGWAAEKNFVPQSTEYYVFTQSLRLEAGETKTFRELIPTAPEGVKYLQFYWDPSNGTDSRELLDVGYGSNYPFRTFATADLEFEQDYPVTKTFNATLEGVPTEVVQGGFLEFDLKVEAPRSGFGIDTGLKLYFFNNRVIDTISEYRIGTCFILPDQPQTFHVKFPVNWNPGDGYYFHLAYQVERLADSPTLDGKQRKIYKYVDFRPRVKAEFKITTPNEKMMTVPDYAKGNGFTAVEDPALAAVTVAPNPCGDRLSVRNTEGVASYELLTLSGVSLRRGVFDGGAETEVSMSDLASGVYLLRIFNAAGFSRIVKVVKE